MQLLPDDGTMTPPIHEPPIPFSEWKLWNAGKPDLAGNSEGVYLLAHFPAAPEGAADPLSEAIVYIGVTGKTPRRTLARRWRAFQKSASTGAFAHAGGRTYHDRFPDGIREDLYVAAYSPSGLDSARVPAFVRYVERRLIWEYVDRWVRLPVCNSE